MLNAEISVLKAIILLYITCTNNSNMKKWKFLFFGVLLVTFFSCSPQKKMNRLVRKNPGLLKQDTLTVVDTFEVVTNRVKTDTVTTLEHFLSDTIVITKENLTVRTFVHKDSVFIEGTCDTIRVETIREVSVPYEKVVVEERFNKILWLPIAILVFLCMFLFFRDK